MSCLVLDPFNAASDDSLATLPLALDPAFAAAQLQRKLAKWSDDDRLQCELDRVEVVRHKPGRRCVLEYDAVVRRVDGGWSKLTMIGKIRAKRFGKSGFRRLEALWDVGFAMPAPDRISVPEPVATVGKLQMWLQRKVPGTVSTELMFAPHATSVARRIAEAAYKLHTSDLVWETSHTMQRELQILQERVPLVALPFPEYRDRLQGILLESERLARTIDQQEVRPIHRDFYQDQVILNGSQVYLLDFDLACMGNPALDIGNFLGHVAEQSLRETGDWKSLAEVEQVLVDRYCALAGEQHRAAIQVYRTLTLVRHIYISSIMPERQETTLPLIQLCETLLNNQGA